MVTYAPPAEQRPSEPLATAMPAEGGCPQELGADAPTTPDGAPQIEPGSHRGCYGIDDPKDNFSLTAPAHAGPVLYRLRVSGAGATACLIGRDADRAVMPHLNGCASGPGAALDAWGVVMGGTSWSLETRDLVGDWRTTARPYVLEIEAIPLDDPGEPDSMENPVPLAIGETKKAYMVNAANATRLDQDYFAVEVPKNMPKKTRFQVVVSDVPEDVQPVLAVHDADKRRIGGGTAANAGATLRAEVKMKGPGTYLFHLRNLVGNNQLVGGKDEPLGRATKPYSITVTVD